MSKLMRRRINNNIMIKFNDSLKLDIELSKRGLDSRYNVLKEIRLFSDNYMENKNKGFVQFELPNKNGEIFHSMIKVIPIYYNGYGAYNTYEWELQ